MLTKRKKITLIVIAVLLSILIVGAAIAEIFIFFADNPKQEKENDEFTQSMLHVKVEDEDKKPVSGVQVTLIPRSKLNKKEGLITFDNPTDKNGESETPLPWANGNFTYPLAPGFNTDGQGRPAKGEYTAVRKGYCTYYDSYTYTDASDTGTSYHLDSKKKSNAMVMGGQAHLTKEANSASDSWHIAGRLGLKYRYGTYIYVYNEKYPDASYGAAVVGDSNGGANGDGLIDQFIPYNKYNGKYGLENPKHKGDDSGGYRSIKPKLLDNFMQKHYGVSNASKKIGSRNYTVYILNTPKGKKEGKKIKSAVIAGNYWPDPTNGSSKKDTKGDKYEISLDGSLKFTPDRIIKTYAAYGIVVGNGKIQESLFNNLKGKMDPVDLNEVYGQHVTVKRHISQNGKDHVYYFTFWITQDGVEAGGADVSVANSVASMKKHREFYHPNTNPCVGFSPKPFAGSALSDCTSWVQARVYETKGHYASTMYGEGGDKKRFNNVNKIKAGDYCAWGYSGEGSGHVVFIEQVSGDSVIISESGASIASGERKKNPKGHWWYRSRPVKKSSLSSYMSYSPFRIYRVK